MNLERVEYAISGGHPVLRLTIDNQKTSCLTEAKEFVVERGLVYLSGWEDKLPKITIPTDRDGNRLDLVLKGFTDDPLIFQVWDQFVEDANSGKYKEMLGNRPIPELRQ